MTTSAQTHDFQICSPVPTALTGQHTSLCESWLWGLLFKLLTAAINCKPYLWTQAFSVSNGNALNYKICKAELCMQDFSLFLYCHLLLLKPHFKMSPDL